MSCLEKLLDDLSEEVRQGGGVGNGGIGSNGGSILTPLLGIRADESIEQQGEPVPGKIPQHFGIPARHITRITVVHPAWLSQQAVQATQHPSKDKEVDVDCHQRSPQACCTFQLALLNPSNQKHLSLPCISHLGPVQTAYYDYIIACSGFISNDSNRQLSAGRNCLPCANVHVTAPWALLRPTCYSGCGYFLNTPVSKASSKDIPRVYWHTQPRAVELCAMG